MPDRQPQAEPEAARDRAGAVVLAYIHSNRVSYSWHHSMMELLGWDMSHEGRVTRGGFIAMRGGTDGLAIARNRVVRLFLEEHLGDWLFWLDTDMGCPPDTIDRLFAEADPVERPIVGALAFTQKEEATDGMGGWRTRAVPVLMDWTVLETGQMGFSVRWDYPPDQLVRCAGTGSACVLIHRSVFEKVAGEYGESWYTRVPNTTMNQLIGEDLSLYLKCGALDIPVHVDTRIKVTHHKEVWLAEDDYMDQRILASFVPDVPPADERVAVIVPVLWRPKSAQPFMDSFKASGTGKVATVYAVADTDDTETVAAWIAAGAQVITRTPGDHPGTFPEKANYGYRMTTEPWLFFAGDDNEFKPGWLDQVMHVAKTTGAQVTGTNDMHNPRVLAGEHATNWLIRRTYVDEVGASWDGPGVAAHEGYGHWFADDEIVTAARHRGVYAHAAYAKVENRHPAWGLGEKDRTWEHEQELMKGDRELFLARAAEHATRAVAVTP